MNRLFFKKLLTFINTGFHKNYRKSTWFFGQSSIKHWSINPAKNFPTYSTILLPFLPPPFFPLKVPLVRLSPSSLSFPADSPNYPHHVIQMSFRRPLLHRAWESCSVFSLLFLPPPRKVSSYSSGKSGSSDQMGGDNSIRWDGRRGNWGEWRELLHLRGGGVRKKALGGSITRVGPIFFPPFCRYVRKRKMGNAVWGIDEGGENQGSICYEIHRSDMNQWKTERENNKAALCISILEWNGGRRLLLLLSSCWSSSYPISNQSYQLIGVTSYQEGRKKRRRRERGRMGRGEMITIIIGSGSRRGNLGATFARYT